MANELYAGTLNDFGDSMAREMEVAFNEARAEAGLVPLPTPGDPVDRQHRQILFIAIARGVIRHLEKKEQAFAITVDVPTVPIVVPTHPDIQVKT